MVNVSDLPHWTFSTGMPLLEQLKQNLLWMISNGSRTGCCTHLSLYSSSPLLQYSNGKNNKLSAQVHISS
jgi:hypothetical protein